MIYIKIDLENFYIQFGFPHDDSIHNILEKWNEKEKKKSNNLYMIRASEKKIDGKEEMYDVIMYNYKYASTLDVAQFLGNFLYNVIKPTSDIDFSFSLYDEHGKKLERPTLTEPLKLHKMQMPSLNEELEGENDED